jgi:hypothetical protein
MTENNQTPRFAEILEYSLNLKLQKFAGTDTSKLPEIYGMIKETVFKVFSKSSRNPTELTKEWVAQKYFENISFSSNKIITPDPTTWDNRPSPVYSPINVRDISTDDLRYIAGLFNEMTFYDDIEKELSNRR